MSNTSEETAVVRRRKTRATKRRALLQILANTKLPTRVREVAWHIAQFINADTGCTYVSPSTIAKRSNGSLRLSHVTEAIKVLEQAQHLKITNYDNGAVLALVARNDIRTPAPLAPIDHRNIPERTKLLDGMAQAKLSSTEKVVGLVAQYVYGIDVGGLPQRLLADVVGVSPSAINAAIKSLSSRNLGEVPQGAGREPFSECPADVQVAFSSKSENEAKSSTSSSNSVNPGNLEKRFLTARAERGQTEIRFDWVTWQRFKELVDMIQDTSNGSGHKSMAGIVALARGWNALGGFTPAEVQTFVRAGLLERKGDDIRLTETSWNFYEWLERIEQQQGEVA